MAALGDADTDERVRILVVRSAGEYYGDQELGLRLAAEAVEIAAHRRPHATGGGPGRALQVAWRPHEMPALDLGAVRTAEQHHAEAIALARAMRRTLVETHLAWSRAMFAGMRGDVAVAQRLAEEAEDLHRRGPRRHPCAHVAARLILLAFRSRRPPQA